jgi:DNA-binding PadR family transcriptional regulator
MKIRKKCAKAFSSYFKNEFKRMMIKIFILKIIKRKKIYSYALIKEITKHEHLKHFIDTKEIKNDVYNAVSALEKEGYIKVSNKKNHIKYYEITEMGNNALIEVNKNFKDTWKRMKQIIK